MNLPGLRPWNDVPGPHVLPPWAAQAELVLQPDADPADFDVQIPAGLAGAARRRRLHYAAGRWCAVRALRQLGWTGDPSQLGRGRNGEPLWPGGLCGSITHSGSRAWAAAARTSDAESIGIDAHERITDERAVRVRDVVAGGEELARAREVEIDFATWLTLVFSAKEALFKCLFPLVQRYFHFLDAELVALDVAERTFTLSLTGPLDDRHDRTKSFAGRFERADEYVYTAIWLGPASSGERA